jgi:NAD(P)-dependent dehydrogenase (short-subunit alcohol dehydrogenase family)
VGLKLNVTSAFLAMKHALPAMVEQGKGVVTAISSLVAHRHVGLDYISYYASKAALSNMVKATAMEYASKGIRVNAIIPGLMKTPLVRGTGLAKAFGLPEDPTDADIEAMWTRRDEMVPMGHMGDAWDVANGAVFLASDAARYITGTELVIDGGLGLGIGRPRAA